MIVKSNYILFLISLLGVSFFILDFTNSNFSWMAFQERDYEKAIKFLLGDGLDHLGPEVTGGGYLPGPFITLMFSIPAYIFKSPIGIFLSLKLCFILNLLFTFYLIKKYFNAKLAWASYFFCLTSSAMYMYVFSGWHAAFSPTFLLMSLFTIDRGISKNNVLWFIFTGLIFGISVQFHASSLIFIIITLLMLLIYKGKDFHLLFLYIIIGFILTFLFYFYQDFKEDFTNTLTIFSIGKNSPKLAFNLSEFILNFYKFIEVYFSRILDGSPDFFNHYFKEIRNGSIFHLLIVIFGIFKLVLYFYGLYKLLINKKNTLINFYIIILTLIPFFIFRLDARWWMFTHPFFEIIVAYGFLHSLKYFKKNFFNFDGVKIKYDILICGTILSLLTLQYFYKSVRVIPFNNHKYKSFSVYPNPYKNFNTITTTLLKLKIKPNDYVNKFHFYRGGHIWPFKTSFQLPSWKHYEYIFKSNNILNPLNLEDKGLILLEKKNLDKINISNLQILEKIDFNQFTALIYKASYFYKTIPLYSSSNIEEQNILKNNNTKNFREIYLENSEINIRQYFEIYNNLKLQIKLLFKLHLREEENGIKGYFEINSPSLRQSSFAEQSPNFVVNPEVMIKLKNNKFLIYNLLNENLYSNQPSTINWEVHKFYGEKKFKKFLGSLFNETPLGVNIYNHNVKINDIISVIFKIDGYGDFTAYNTEFQKHNINNEKIIEIKLK